MRILVTGGAGYIGSHTAKSLAGAGYEPVALDNLNTGHRWAVQWGRFVQCDLGDFNLLREVLKAYVGESMRDPSKYFRNNVVNTLNLLDAMIDTRVRHIIFSSSCATYGLAEKVPIPEDHAQLPVNPYGESKLFVERALNWYGHSYGLRWTALRYFNAAGADPEGEIGEDHDPEPHLIPRAIQAALGEIPFVEVYGSNCPTPDGTAIRDYIHVTDLAETHCLALANILDEGENTALNLGTGKGHSAREVIAAVERASGCYVPVLEAERPAGAPPCLVADGAKAKELLAWQPRHSSLDEIVETAWQWHARQSHVPAARVNLESHEAQVRVQQQIECQQVRLSRTGWNPPRQSPLPPYLRSNLFHGDVRHFFAWSGCELSTVAFHLAQRLFFAFVMLPLLLLAADGGNIAGKIEESGGGRLAGVKVTLVNQETKARQEVVTAEDGRFSLTGLTPGTYLLQIEASGFEPYKANVQVGTEKLNTLKIKLKLRTVEEEITVRPDTTDDRLSPETNTDSMKIDETFFNGLPLEVDYLQPFIDTFTSPAAQGSEGTSIVVDGVDGGELDMPTTAIRTVKINRNPYSAEFQHPGSARAEITTKHGHKKRYEGNIAFYARNSVFDARNAFANTNPNLNRRFVEGSLGGSLPGRSGSFFLAGQRLMNDQSAVVNSLNTVALTGPVNINVPTPQRRDHFFARTQWSLTEVQSLSLNYTFTDGSSENNGVGALSLPEQGFSDGKHTHRAQLTDSVTFSPQLRNEVIFIFKNQEYRMGGPASGPQILVNGAFTGGPSQSFNGKERHTFDIQDTISYIRGKQNFLFGATVKNDWWKIFDATNFGGTFEFSSLDQYRNVVQNHVGTPDLFQINQGDPRVSFLAQQTSGFAQDTMRVLPNLSLTLGLRYDWQNTLDDRKNLAPRFALAYTPGKRHRTVLRAGAGIFYDNLPRIATEQALLVDGVRVREINISQPLYPDPFLGGQVTSPPPSITRVATDAQSPYLIQTSGGVEEEIWAGTWLSMEYSFLHGVHLLRVRDVNAPLPSGSGLRPDPTLSNIEELQSTGFVRGHALTLTFRGGWGKHFKGYGQYIFSRYTNDTSGVFSFPADNYNLRPEIGPADFDRRHRVNFAGTVQLPVGFRVGSILSAASGAPFNIVTGSDLYGDTVSRPPGVTRNTGGGPGMVQLDVRLTKIFSLERTSDGKHHHSRRSMEFSADAFNAINHTNVTNIIGVLSSPLFGQAAAASAARTIQLSAKYSF